LTLDSARNKQCSLSQRSFRQRLRYKSDEFLSGGAGRQLGFLFGLTVALVAIFTLLSYAGKSAGFEVAEGDSWLDRAWFYFGRVMDAGTMTGDAGNVNRLVSTLATILGVIVAGLLISSLAGNFQERLEAIKRGGSPVVERGHYLILGWSEKVFTVIDQLTEANIDEKGLVFVVMAEHDKVQMEEALQAKVRHASRIKLVARTGSSMIQADLSRVAFDEARAIVALVDSGPDSDAHRADGRVIKTLMALFNHPEGKQALERVPVTAEVLLLESRSVAEIASRGRACIVNTNEVVSKIILQTARISGLSLVYEELLRFEGNEIHVVDAPGARGRPFGELLFDFPNAVPIGVSSNNGRNHLLNPPPDRVVAQDESVLVVAEDEHVQFARYQGQLASMGDAPAPAQPPPVEHLLVLGWNEKVFPIAREYDSYVGPGSSLTLVNSLSIEERSAALDKHVGPLKNVTLQHMVGEFSSRALLAELQPQRFPTVLVLGDTSHGDTDSESADTRAIVALLLLRDFRERAGLGAQEVCSEILDPRNRELAATTRIHDIVISNEMVSMVLAQVTQAPQLMSVLEDLFASEGSEIYLKAMSLYTPLGVPSSFEQLSLRAKARGEVAIGLQVGSASAVNWGISINPWRTRGQAFTPQAGDRLIVLAENDG
jgi:ion channel POLLUX/CASTOR